MRIHQLSIRNLMGISEVTIEPYPGVNVIAGENGNGKSSLLDAIYFGLAGESAQKDISRPIKDGAEEAQVTIDLGDFTVTRKWKQGKTSELVVTAKDGAKYTKPRAFLDEKLGSLSFDPLSFARMSSKEQMNLLLSMVKLPFSLEELEEQRKAAYDERTDVNRALKQAESALAQAPKPLAEVPEHEVSVSEIVSELRDAQALASHKLSLEESCRQLQGSVESLAESLRVAQADLEEKSKELNGLVVPDVEELERRLEQAETVNASVRDAKRYLELVNDVAELKKISAEFSARLTALDQQKAEGIASATMPLEGLSFGDDGVTYKGTPLSQCSSAERLRISIAMAAAMNPHIRVMRIEDGPLLDKQNLQALMEEAEAKDLQVFVERIEPFGDQTFVVRDGIICSEPVPGGLA